jgi:8-oxo-dGTP pyrophosphatase MutT (NUDIX family)
MVEANKLEPGGATAICPSSPLAIVEQAGALCIRDNGGVREVLLVSSLDSDRLGIPKGHVEPDESSWSTAEREAFEEAGIVGIAHKSQIGGFFYRKSLGEQTYYLRVYRLDILECAADYPEKNLRTVTWVPLAAAVKAASRRGLRKLLLELLEGEQRS